MEFRAEWDNPAHHSGAYELEGRDRPWVLVTEPFRSGFEPGPTRVSVHGPEGYERSVDSQPPQLRAQRNSMLWNPQTSNFLGFYAEFLAIEGDSTDATSGGDDSAGVGDFLKALVLASIPVAVVLAVRRWRQ